MRHQNGLHRTRLGMGTPCVIGKTALAQEIRHRPTAMGELVKHRNNVEQLTFWAQTTLVVVWAVCGDNVGCCWGKSGDAALLMLVLLMLAWWEVVK